MKRRVLIGCLVLFAGGAVAYAVLAERLGNTVKRLPPANSPLLPNGQQWHFSVKLPSNISKDDFVGLQVRRSSVPHDPNEGIAISPRSPWLSQEEAEAVFSTAYIGQGTSLMREATVAFQIIDLEDYLANEELENPLRMFGGLQYYGSSSRLSTGCDTVLGIIDGYSLGSHHTWKDGELCLLQFRSHDDNRLYDYDLVLTAKPAEDIPDLSSP